MLGAVPEMLPHHLPAKCVLRWIHFLWSAWKLLEPMFSHIWHNLSRYREEQLVFDFDAGLAMQARCNLAELVCPVRVATGLIADAYSGQDTHDANCEWGQESIVAFEAL